MTIRQRKVLRRAKQLFPESKPMRVRWLLAVRYLRKSMPSLWLLDSSMEKKV